MRTILAVLCILLVTSACLAVPPAVESKSSVPPVDRREAVTYAIQLYEITRHISDKYVRAIPQADLAAAALSGLYEAGRVPIPPNLAADLHKAKNQHAFLVFVTSAREAVGGSEALRGPKAIEASLRALTSVLDPHCVVLKGTELQRSNYGPGTEGLGFDLLEHTAGGHFVVKTVVLGSPAQREGLRPGDQITHIDGRPVTSHSPAAAGLITSGRAQFTVVRPGTNISRTIQIRIESFQTETVLGVNRRLDNSWSYVLDPENKIAHVRLAGLEVNTVAELTRVLSRLDSDGMQGLILDLRWCPGGYLDTARTIAALFQADYNLPYFMLPTPWNWVALADLHLDTHCANAIVEYRAGEKDDPNLRPAGSGLVDFPMVVLVNRETSGGGELVAAVLQDNLRALIAGQRTRGKASVQRVVRFSGDEPWFLLTAPIPDLGMKLSNGLLRRPSGKNLNRFPESTSSDDWGVRPDAGLEIPISTALSNQLKEWWQWQSLRPGGSNESLPLDEPGADPQRHAAWQTLREIIERCR